MPYGLTESEIVSSFSGAVSGDFAVPPLDGYTVINQEIELQWQKLNMSMSDKVAKMMDEISFEVVNISAGVYVTPGLFAIPATLELWKVSRSANICGKQSFRSCNCSLDSLVCGITKLVLGTDYSSLGNNVYQLVESVDIDEEFIVASYKVDASNVSLTSLTSILRDMVCANLGNRLFAAVEGGKWSIVEHYETQAEKWLKMLEGGWMPAELKKMKIMFSGTVGSIRVGRG